MTEEEVLEEKAFSFLLYLGKGLGGGKMLLERARGLEVWSGETL